MGRRLTSWPTPCAVTLERRMRAEYAVVSPEYGIAEGYTVHPPDEGLPLWLVAVSLRQASSAGVFPIKWTEI